MNGILVSAFCCVALSACGLFDTREPEPPTQGGSTFVPPTTPEIVLQNLSSAVLERNTGNYIRCLADSLSFSQAFQFIPAAGAAARYPTTFAAWSVQSEQSYFSALSVLAEESGKSSLALSGSFSVRASDSAIYEGDYELTFGHGVGGVPETVTGKLQFVIASDRNSSWSIVRWTDLPQGIDPSWSDFKGRFAN